MFKTTTKKQNRMRAIILSKPGRKGITNNVKCDEGEEREL